MFNFIADNATAIIAVLIIASAVVFALIQLRPWDVLYDD
jgi:hypothetical protein